jgi:hypothetical protein
VHEKPRCRLITPIRINGVPPIRALTALRVTEGTWVGSGRSFRKVDSWTSRSSAHEQLPELWTGSTWFAEKCCTASEPSESLQRPLRAPACYGERPLRGSEQRSVLEVRCSDETAGSESAIKLEPTPTRGTGSEMHERQGALSVRHLPRQHMHVKRHVRENSDERAHVMKRAPVIVEANRLKYCIASVLCHFAPGPSRSRRAPRVMRGFETETDTRDGDGRDSRRCSRHTGIYVYNDVRAMRRPFGSSFRWSESVVR